jgi:hypothetical protein
MDVGTEIHKLSRRDIQYAVIKANLIVIYGISPLLQYQERHIRYPSDVRSTDTIVVKEITQQRRCSLR